MEDTWTKQETLISDLCTLAVAYLNSGRVGSYMQQAAGRE